MATPDELTQSDSRPRRAYYAAERVVFHAVPGLPPSARNVNDLAEERSTIGQRLADAITGVMGSWWFIGVQSAILAVWISLNVLAWIRHWDAYPFILLNLALSFQAAYAAPIIMMSQNREAAKDRLQAEEDYRVNIKAELEVASIQARLDSLMDQSWAALLAMQERQLELLARIEKIADSASASGSRRRTVRHRSPRRAGGSPRRRPVLVGQGRRIRGRAGLEIAEGTRR